VRNGHTRKGVHLRLGATVDEQPPRTSRDHERCRPPGVRRERLNVVGLDTDSCERSSCGVETRQPSRYADQQVEARPDGPAECRPAHDVKREVVAECIRAVPTGATTTHVALRARIGRYVPAVASAVATAP